MTRPDLMALGLLPQALRRLAERRLAARARAARALVLSYDDGPGPALTPQLLDLLGAEDARASFFAIGRNAAARPDLVARALAESHEVGSHTETHLNAWETPPGLWARDLEAGVARIGGLGGAGRLFRPPFGKMTLPGLAAGRRLGLAYAWWTVDSRDAWDRRPAGDVVAEVRARGGGVVLMHDFDRFERAEGLGHRDHVGHCLDLTARLIRLARTEGYRLLPLGSLLSSATEAKASASASS